MFGVACHNMSVCSAFSVFCVVRAQLIVLNSSSIPGSAKINCNTSSQNVPKWGKICTGLKFDLVHFNAPQTKFKNIDNFEGPCRTHDVDLGLVLEYFLSPTVLIFDQSSRQNCQSVRSSNCCPTCHH